MFCYTDYNYFQLGILMALLVLLVLAILWEAKDYQRLEARTPLNKITNKDKKEKELQFYACFNAENNIQWRGIFIMTFVSTLLITYLITEFYPNQPLNINLLFLVFGAIILVFYIGHMFRSFHLYRNMCSKVRCDQTVI